jgi:NADH-quinone oxidoreductase subunit M
MILVWILALPLVGGAAAWALGRLPRRGASLARWTALLTLVVDLGLALSLWARAGEGPVPAPPAGRWLVEVSAAWIPALGVRFHLAADGLSLVLTLLTLFLGVVAVGTAWRSVGERPGLFHACLLWVLGGVLGVFLAVDLLLFFFAWELMIVPMYLLITLWGHADRVRAGLKFFVFTQASGLLLLVSILGLALHHRAQTGALSFDYVALLGTPPGPGLGPWLMMGFFLAFAVKLPVVPLHTWLPAAHAEAPAAGSLVLAGVLLKTGAYGLLRFAVPLFPQASQDLAPVALVLGAVGVVYGAFQAWGQRDLKRLVAYTSVSHMGFVLLGVYAFQPLAAEGVVLQLVCHGLSTGGLFLVAGVLHERLHTRDLADLGGLWPALPRLGAAAMVLAMASLGLPGLGNFVAEVLILMGAFRADVAVTAVATGGLVLATAYSLALVQRVFLGRPPAGARGVFPSLRPEPAPRPPLLDLGVREVALFAALIVALVWLGLWPQPVLDLARPALSFVPGAGAGVAAGGLP